MTPTTLALQMPTKSKEESISSFERTRPAAASGFAGKQFWRTAQLQIRSADETLRNACTDS
jgi:hypothetical protein